MNKTIRYCLAFFVFIYLLAFIISKLLFNTQTKALIASQKDKHVEGAKTVAKVITPTSVPTSTPTPTTPPTGGPTPTHSTDSGSITPTFTPTPTASPTPKPIVTSDQALEELFVKYSTNYNIDKNLLEKIANCESHFNPGAKNGPYAGMFQFAEPIWASTRKLMGTDTNPDLRYSAEESIKTAAFLLSQSHTNLWPTCSK